MTVIRVGAAQLSLQVGAIKANRSTARAAIDGAANAGVQLLVLPELVPTGYVFADAQEARALAEPIDGPTVSEWTALSAQHRLVLIAGFAELGPDGVLYNSAVLIDNGDLRAVYRKAHLWDREHLVFTPGRARPPVVSTSLGVNVAVMICYDLEFPEWTRAVALDGADLLAAPTNWPAAAIPVGQQPIEVIKVQAAAATNRIYIVACDRCGTERGVEWVGGSMIVDPDGYPLAGPLETARPALLSADVDTDQARDKHLNATNDVLADRRIDLY